MIIAPRADLNIVTSNIPVIETGIAVYDPTVTYNLNDVVQINGTVNRLYEAVQDVPAGIDPVVDVNATTGIGTYWFDRGSTNYMRAFDELGSSKCSNLDSIYYSFTTSDVDILMIDGIENASTIRIIVTDNVSGTVFLDKTDDITTRDVYDWFDWTYAPTEYRKTYFSKLPLVYDATLEIYIDDVGSTIEVGYIAFGRGVNYGLSLIDPSPTSSMRGITSKKRDAFGNIITRRKARYKRMKITCIINSTSVDIMEERLNALADKPAIFVGDDRDGGYTALLIYGELKDHDMPISVSKTKYQLEVEGYL